MSKAGKRLISAAHEIVRFVVEDFGPTEVEDFIAEAITEAFGERCPDFEPECYCCRAWAQYDALKGRSRSV